MESSTQVLRRMLDERGVEWTANDGEHVKETCWPYMGELTAAFAEYDNGETRFVCDMWCSPAQAIAATLGDEGVGRSNDGVAELEAENARLRELVADMYKAFMHGACYRWCEFKEPCNYISDGKCQWYDRGHELGVEVDDG